MPEAPEAELQSLGWAVSIAIRLASPPDRCSKSAKSRAAKGLSSLHWSQSP
ncbi:hypothetical protein FHS96_001619 [Sphingomonas zeicaulis]